MDKKLLVNFFADRLRNHSLTDEDETVLQKMLFPSYEENPNKAFIESTHDMLLAYEQWEMKRKPDDKPNPAYGEPMTDAEIDELAAII